MPVSTRCARASVGALLVLGAFVPASWGAQLEYAEMWNSATLREHNWKYWGTGVLPGVVDQACSWQSVGGYQNSPRTMAALGSLDLDFDAYWPFYTVAGMRDSATQDVDFFRSSVTAMFNDHGTDDVLSGGSLHFFVGEYIDEDEYAWYYHNTPFEVNHTDGAWSLSTTIVCDDLADWTMLDGSNERTLAQLWDNPQQYGFVVVGATDAPHHNMSIDNFEAHQVPEPGAVALFSSALVALSLRRFARRRGR